MRIIKLFLVTILMVGLADAQVKHTKAIDNGAREIEMMELEDHSEEKKELSNNDLEEDDTLSSFVLLKAAFLNGYCSGQNNNNAPFHSTGVFLPPPEL